MKSIKRYSTVLLTFAIVLVVAVSCENKDDELFDTVDAQIDENIESIVGGGLVNCQVLNNIYTNHQVSAANKFKTAFDQYLNCGPAQPYTGSCCSSKTVYLVPNGGYSTSYVRFERWRPWYVPGSGVDYLGGSNVLSKSEQLNFIERAIDIANSSSIPCNGGQLIPGSYSLEVRPTTHPNTNWAIADVAVKVTYSPVCYFSFP